eukprot:TRINITY_DN5198_c0_g1_i3.p1 TRINITY_DN5198_c0_g1~~TRINITY_DN5198_c0_g1_i3.p1  ORF type:complete len:140 (-),score=36.37 TRINITY_DN5198_c0_g1_i3:133-492(-)
MCIRDRYDAQNYLTPDCYTKLRNTLTDPILKKLTVETLIYMFYNIWERQTQQAAVVELYNKGWRYSAALDTWFTDLSYPRDGTVLAGRYFNLTKWEITTPPEPVEISASNLQTLEDFLA